MRASAPTAARAEIGEAVACDGDGMPEFDRLRYRRQDFAFDLIELNGQDLRREPIESASASSRPCCGRPGWFRVRRRRVQARLQDGARGHRLEAARLALPLRPLAGLAQDEEPGGGGEARGGGGVGEGEVAMRTTCRRGHAKEAGGHCKECARLSYVPQCDPCRSESTDNDQVSTTLVAIIRAASAARLPATA
jgi:hypothetical protein